MITRTQAERIAAAIHLVRVDWPVKQLVTLCTTTDAANWPPRDLFTALAYIALDQSATGAWISESPYRVLGEGPWLKKLDTAGDEHLVQRSAAEATERREQIRIRNQAIAHCSFCSDPSADDEIGGRLPNGQMCLHDQPVEERTAQAQRRAAAARALIRPAPKRIDVEPGASACT